jgi:hypothetical protein
MRCEALLEMHCRVFELNEFCTDPEKLAAREKLGTLTPKAAKKKKSVN